MSKRNNNLGKKKYIKILLILFFINTLIAIGGSVVKQKLGYDYVFHCWLDVTHSVAWVLMIGLIFIIPLTYLNVWLGSFFIAITLIIAYAYACLNYNEEIQQGEYIVIEIQQLGEKGIYYYKDVNIFIMKRSHEEYV
ncbi:MAG: hypothetical protein Q3980_06235 [Turicibacter sp.]|nr:hypothetical protein [Turicibacter sp.]